MSLPGIRYHLVITKSLCVVNVQLLKYEEIYLGSGLVGCLESQALGSQWQNIIDDINQHKTDSFMPCCTILRES